MFGNKIIEVLRAGFLTVIGAIALDKLLTLTASPKQVVSCTSGVIVTPTTTNTFAGSVGYQNTSGGTLGTLTMAVLNTNVTAKSIILVVAATDSHSMAGQEYVANEVSASRVPGVSFRVIVHRATPTSSASYNNGEGGTFSYIIIN